MRGEDEFRRGLETLLNVASRENGSNTPDFILAGYLMGCLEAFDAAVNWRETWSGRRPVAPPVCEPKPEPDGPPENEADAVIYYMAKGFRYQYRTCRHCGSSQDFYKKGDLYFHNTQCSCNAMSIVCIRRVSEATIRRLSPWLKRRG